MDVFNFKCKYCGGELNSVDGLKSVGKCKYCGSKQTLPKLEDEKRANLFERANHLRRNNEFDKAEALYEQLLNEDLTDPEAYWSLVLCRYGIEYVEDKRTGERLPTVNRMQMVSILADEDYKSAIANADDEQKKLYEEEARLINEIQKGILEIARKEEPFDIFICYKETDSEGKRSRDSILAQDLYHELTRDGYKVFFARVTLQGKLGSAYEPYIFSALNSAKVMVVLGTKKEHFEAVWVRNEWSRFLGQIKKGERKALIPAYRDMDAYDLPVEFSNLQALDMSRLGFLQELVEGVENILKAYKKKEAPKSEPAPTYAPAPTPEPPKKKKKSKAPIVIVAILLALAIAGVGIFASGVLDPFFGGSQTEETTDNKTEKPTERPSLPPQDSHETESDPPRQTESDEPTDTSEPTDTAEPTDTDKSTDTAGKTEEPTEETDPTFTENGLAYTTSNDGLIYISGIGNYTSDKLVIPAEINGKKVYGIADRAFHGIRELKSVVISDGIEKIGKNAFAECTLIESLLIGNSVSEIGEYAFDQLVSISTLEIPDSVVSVGAYAFRNCCRAKTVRIGEGVVTIGDHAFEQCNSFTELVIPDSVESIGESAFYDCTLLNSVTLGRGLRTVGASAFDGVSDVKKVNYRGSAADWQKIDIAENNVYLTDESIEHNYNYVDETESPTDKSTEEPTTAPTEKPTNAPTEKPTEKPTEEPTEAPAPEITVENPVTVIEEGKAYLGVLAHKNLDKFIYLNGTIDGYYLGAVDNEAAAANVYFERSTDGNYYMYFLENDTKVYVNLFLSGSYINYSLDPTPDTVWHYNQDYKCLVGNLGGELIFLGTSNTGTYGNFAPKRVSEIDGYFTMQLIVSHTEEPTVPPTEEPTTAPTEKPTNAPTEKPTEEPTEAPAPEITVENPVTVIEEGKAYLGVLAHKNLDKFIYLNGTIDGYYLGAVDNEADAANVYFERSTDDNYYMYFLENDTKAYVNLIVSGSYINYSLDPTPDTVWHYNQDFKCLVANLGGELIFLGTSNTGTYGNFVPKRVSEIDGYFTMQLIVSPVQPVGEPSLEFVFDSATDSYRVVGLGSVTGENVVIPSTYNGKPVKFIGARAFEKCIDMKSLTVPKSIVHIDDYAFNNCINLVHITYEGSYEEWMEINTSIWGNDSLRNEGMKMDYGQVAADPEPENYDFSFVWAPDGESFYVAGLWEYADPSRVVIPETHKGLFVTGINDYAFQANNEITALYIPATVSYIGENAFAECPKLSKVEFEGTAATWKGIHMGDGNDALKTADVTYEVLLDACQHKEVERESCFVYCMDCLKHVATEHQQPVVVEKIESTDGKEGYITYKCDECFESWTEVIPPSSGGSDADSDSVKTVMSAEELKALITQINNGEVSNDITIKIGVDIDFDGLYFEPIHEFRGTIDGNGKTISNITLTENGASVSVRDGNGSEYNTMAIGFISKAYGVTVRDLTLDSVTADISTAQNIYIGALAGYADGIVIEDSAITSNLALKETGRAGTTGVAGVIGYSLDALMERVNVDATIDHTAQSGESHTGAILGAGNVRIHNCTIDLAVKFIGQSGAGHAGWLLGREYTDADVDCATLQGSTVTGTFEASDCMYAWGAVGQGYFYIEHGEQIDIYEYNTKIDIKGI